MSKLSAFLNPVTTQEEKEVVISKRFLDENGSPVPFKIRALSQEENDKITKQATRRTKESGQSVDRLDNADYARRIILEATVEPDFRAKEMCDRYGVLDPLQVPGKMLLSGEYRKLMDAIMELSGFGDPLEDEVKN